MELNVLKCLVISYKRGDDKILLYLYFIMDSCVLKRVEIVRTLGMIMTSSLCPLEHVLHIYISSQLPMGFIFRFTKNFNSPLALTLIVLYKTLVHYILEYSSVI